MLKNMLKKFIPEQIRLSVHKMATKIHHNREDQENRGRSAREVFSEIYAKAKWGGSIGEINSGAGSYGPAAEIYIKQINEYIIDNGIKSVVDIGCGDYSVGKSIICDDYTGIDVVQAVVDRNNLKFSSISRRFICADAAGSDTLPEADMCLVRQVLQHLSNDQVKSVLDKALEYKFCIITEHHPAVCDFKSYNKDIVHGSNTRLSYGSGLYLDRPPFNLDASLLFEYSGNIYARDIYLRGSIRSFIIKRSSWQS